MKILWLSHEQDLGGANKCLAEQIKILHREGDKISVIVPRDDSFAAYVRGDVQSVHEVYFYFWINDIGKQLGFATLLRRLLRNAMAVWKIMGIIRRERPDYVATNTMTIPVAAIAAKLMGRRHAWFIHEFGEEDHGYRIVFGTAAGIRWMSRLSTKVVFNSEAVKKKFAPHVNPGKIYIAHNPVVLKDPKVKKPAALAVAPDGIKILNTIILGQIAPSKNQLEALQAMALLQQENRLHIKLQIIGNVVNYDYLDAINRFIEEQGLADAVTVLGYVNNPADHIRAADCLLMCSRMEAFGRVTVEALKCGVPVIASRSGGSPEIVDEGVTGYLYEQGNARQLADRLLQMADTHHLFDSNSIANIANKKFNEEHTKQQLKAVFH